VPGIGCTNFNLKLMIVNFRKSEKKRDEKRKGKGEAERRRESWETAYHNGNSLDGIKRKNFNIKLINVNLEKERVTVGNSVGERWSGCEKKREGERS